jgi:hypothetical protein
MITAFGCSEQRERTSNWEIHWIDTDMLWNVCRILIVNCWLQTQPAAAQNPPTDRQIDAPEASHLLLHKRSSATIGGDSSFFLSP